MRKVKTHTFRGKKYDIDLDDTIGGFCEFPFGGRPSLSVNVDLETRQALEFIIHEGLHACDYSKTEQLVAETAHDIARLLWRLGYLIK